MWSPHKALPCLLHTEPRTSDAVRVFSILHSISHVNGRNNQFIDSVDRFTLNGAVKLSDIVRLIEGNLSHCFTGRAGGPHLSGGAHFETYSFASPGWKESGKTYTSLRHTGATSVQYIKAMWPVNFYWWNRTWRTKMTLKVRVVVSWRGDSVAVQMRFGLLRRIVLYIFVSAATALMLWSTDSK